MNNIRVPYRHHSLAAIAASAALLTVSACSSNSPSNGGVGTQSKATVSSATRPGGTTASASASTSATSESVATEDIPITGGLISSFPEPKGIKYTITTARADTVIISYTGFIDVDKFLKDYQSVLKTAGWTDLSYSPSGTGIPGMAGATKDGVHVDILAESDSTVTAVLVKK